MLTTVEFELNLSLSKHLTNVEHTYVGISRMGDTRQRHRPVKTTNRERTPSRVRLRPRRNRAAPRSRPIPSPSPRRVALTDSGSNARFELIRHIVDLEPGSPEERQAIRAAVQRGIRSEKTVCRLVAKYREHGMLGLMRQTPANGRAPRVVVSRTFDRAFRIIHADEGLLRKIGAQGIASAKGLWGSAGAQAGWTEIKRNVELVLLEMVERLGLELPPDAIRVSRYFVEKYKQYALVFIATNDKKAFYDGKPRIARDFTGLAPMDIVCGDVKFLDNQVWHFDKGSAWPKAVVFTDLGTNRVFVVLFLLPRGKGVRQEHVIEAFLAMAAHREWGLPKQLYLDNGSEFGGLDKLQKALVRLGDGAAPTVVRALPYNPVAKPVESVLSRLNRYVFSQIPGFAGGDRMNKKTQKLGSEPQPFPGDWEEFRATANILIANYHTRPIGGRWDNRSPDSWFAEKLSTGWQRSWAEIDELDAAFSDPATGRVDRGVIPFGGHDYYSPHMDHAHRASVQLRVPWRQGATPVFLDKVGKWRRLEVSKPFIGNDPAGIVEGQARRRRHGSQVGAMRREIKQIDRSIRDPIAIAKRRAERRPTHDVPSSAIPRDLGAEHRAIAAGFRSDEPANAEPTADVWAARRAQTALYSQALAHDRRPGEED